MPQPNQTDDVGRAALTEITNRSLTNPVDKDTLTERIDFNESSSSQWFGRYSWNEESSFAVTPTMTLVDGNVLYTRASQWVVSNVRTLSPTKVNEARFGYNSLFNNITQQLANVRDVNKELGTPFKVTDPNSWGIPNIGLSPEPERLGQPDQQPVPDRRQVFPIRGQLLLYQREALAAHGWRVPLQQVPAGRK